MKETPETELVRWDLTGCTQLVPAFACLGPWQKLHTPALDSGPPRPSHRATPILQLCPASRVVRSNFWVFLMDRIAAHSFTDYDAHAHPKGRSLGKCWNSEHSGLMHTYLRVPCFSKRQNPYPGRLPASISHASKFQSGTTEALTFNSGA